MPAHILVEANPLAPSVSVGFSDAEGNSLEAPNGAVANFTTDNPSLKVDANPNNPLKGHVTLTEEGVPGSATIGITVEGANDVDGNPFPPIEIKIYTSPPIITPGSVGFQVFQQ